MSGGNLGRLWACGLSVALAGGCAGDDDLGSSSVDASGGNADSESLGDSACTVTSTTKVGWTEQTSLGTPKSLFASASGSCEAPFTWDGSGWSKAITITPATGEGTITTELTVNQSSARWVERKTTQQGAIDSDPCLPLLKVDAVVSLSLSDSKLIKAQTVTLSASDTGTSSELHFSVVEAEFGDFAEIVRGENTTSVVMNIAMSTSPDTCAGQVSLGVNESSGNGMASEGWGPLGTWSDTGCLLGTEAVALDEPYQGVELGAAVTKAFGAVSLQGIWDDESSTVMELVVSIEDGPVCVETSDTFASVVTIPVTVLANTEDARIVDLKGAGTVRVSVLDGAITRQELWLSEDLLCDTGSDKLSYTSADCSELDSVTAQLGINFYSGEPEREAGGALRLYEHARDGSTTEEDTDDAVTLTLKP